jgi:arylsulfatase A-like enzyme
MFRSFIRNLLLIYFLLISSISFSQKPNIIWITVEDISPTLSMYGDSTAKTPNLDELASESLIFTEAFTTVGVCSPSRSSLITGMYPVSIGTHQMRTGKDVFGWGSRDYDGVSNAIDVNGDSIPLHSVVTPPEVKCFTEYLRAEGYYCTNNSKTDYQFAAPVTAWDQNSNNAHWKNREKNQPFFSVFNFDVTHESKMWLHRDKPLTVKQGLVPLPPYFPDTETVRNDVARNYSNIELLDKMVGNLIKELKADGLFDKTYIFFFSDHGGPLPRGKRSHYESGLKVPMMVRDPYEKKIRYVDDQISFVDLAPTTLSLTGLNIPDHFQGRAFMGEKKSEILRDYVFGSGDRFDETYDRVRSVISKEFIYVKNYYTNRPAYKDVLYRKNIDMTNEMLMLYKEDKLNSDQKYWYRESKTREEFYVRSEDPHSLKNLISDERYEDEINKHRMALKNWQDEINDIGAKSEKKHLDSMWPRGIQPKSSKPDVTVKDKTVTIKSNTLGSSNAFIISDNDFEPSLDDGWKLYHEPIKVNKGYIYVISTRLGYEDSEIIKIKL